MNLGIFFFEFIVCRFDLILYELFFNYFGILWVFFREYFVVVFSRFLVGVVYLFFWAFVYRVRWEFVGWVYIVFFSGFKAVGLFFFK